MAKDLVLSVAKHFSMASPRTDAYQAVTTPSVIVVTTTVEVVLAPLVVPFREYIIFLVV